MIKKLFSFFIGSFITIITLFTNNSNAHTKPNHETRPIVVELFTSQGCSSCPPADKFLAELAQDYSSEVLALSYHVDYWDYIGWKDPFSNAKYSSRQREYAKVMGKNGVYTPQAVIDGILEAVGSNRDKIFANIKIASFISEYVHLSTLDESDNSVTIFIEEKKSDKLKNANIILVGYDSKHETNVVRGENIGKKLVNYNVVKNFEIIGQWLGEKKQVTFDKPNTQNFVVLLQEIPQGRIIGSSY